MANDPLPYLKACIMMMACIDTKARSSCPEPASLNPGCGDQGGNLLRDQVVPSGVMTSTAVGSSPTRGAARNARGLLGATVIGRDAEHPEEPEIYHYVVVRGDLPCGVAAAQITHAAGWTGGPEAVGARAVVVEARDETELATLAELLNQRSIAHEVIHEPDAPWFGAAMAIGVYPQPRDHNTRRTLGRLTLYQGDR